MDCGKHFVMRKGQHRAWKLARLCLLIAALGVGGWGTGALAARAHSHRHTTSRRTTHSHKTSYVTRNPLASLKAGVERNARKGRVFDRSTDDGSVRAYFYKGRLQKLKLHLLGERGQSTNTYYLQGKWVFCVVKERWIYNRPLSVISSRPLKMAKVKQEEYYLAKGLVLHRASPTSKLTKLSSSRRKAAERQLTRECTEASRILKTHGKSASSKKATPSKPHGDTKSKRGSTNRGRKSLASAAGRRM